MHASVHIYFKIKTNRPARLVSKMGQIRVNLKPNREEKLFSQI